MTNTTNDAAAIAPPPPAAPDAAAAAKRSPTTIEIALRIMSHPFPTSAGTDGNDNGPSRGPGDPNSFQFLVLPGTGLGGNLADLPLEILQLLLNMNRVGTKRGPFSRMDACEQLGVLSRKRDDLIEALESAGDGGREVAESITNMLTSLGPSIPTASTTVTPRRLTRRNAAAATAAADTDAADTNGRTPKTTNRQGGAEAPAAVHHTTSFIVTRNYAALSALLSGFAGHLLDNLRGRNNASLRKVIKGMAALFNSVLPSADALVGIKSIGGIQVGKLLGEGSFGQVRRGVFTDSFGKKTQVAVKEFKIREEDQPIENIQEEIHLLRAIGEFRYIPTVINHIVTPFFAAMVMDFMDGGIFDDMDCKLSDEEVKTYVRQLIACLMAMDAKGVCHRDIKPENLGLKTDADGNSTLQLLDLGLARFDANEAKTQVGTPGYMAPEVNAGNGRKTYHGISADMWSAGVTVVELMLSAEAFDEVKKSRRSDGGFDPSLVKSKIQGAGHSEDLASLVTWMLTVDPTKRPSPLQAYEHAAFKGMESLFESQLKDWAWVLTVLRHAADIASLEGRIVRLRSDHDAQLSELAGRATTAEAAVAAAEAALAAAAAEEANEDDLNAAAAAAAAAAVEVDGANPGGLNAMQRHVVMVAYNHESRENPNSLPNTKFLAVTDSLHGLVTFEQVREFITQGGNPKRNVIPQILTEAQIMTFGTNRARTELGRCNLGGRASGEGCRKELIKFFRVYW